MSGSVLVVRSSADLPALFDRKTRYRAVRLEAALPEPDRSVWEHRLAHGYGACGCGTANFGGAAGVLAAGIWTAVQWDRLAVDPWFVGGAAAGVVLIGAVGGKLFGLATARRRLRRDAATLESLLPATASSV